MISLMKRGLTVLLFMLITVLIVTRLHLKTPVLFFTNFIEDDLMPIFRDKPLVDPVFKVKPLVIWSTDFHIGPIHDMKNFLSPMGVKFIDKSLDYTRCHRTGTCEGMKTLKLINPHNGKHLNYSWIPAFYELYKNDSEIQSADAFACFHMSSFCELYEPFNKSLIIISTHRYELGRFGRERWTRWNQNLIRYASDPWNVVGANNLYDVEYMKHFTGIQPQYLPSFCDYTGQTYNQSKKGYLVAHSSNPGFLDFFFRNFRNACKIANCSFELASLRHKYGGYRYFDLAAHWGIVHVPYQVSVMSFFEQYRMNIPLFAPSKQLLIEWEFKHTALCERTWFGAQSLGRPHGSDIEPHVSQRSVPDPNNVFNETCIRHWLQFCDYYHFPYVTYFDSERHLVEILEKITSEELWRISEQMKKYNVKEKRRLKAKWKNLLLKIADHSPNKPH